MSNRVPIESIQYVSSSSNPGATHTVTTYVDGTHWCSCKGFLKARHCRHTETLGLTQPVERKARVLSPEEVTARRKDAARRAWVSRRIKYGER